MDLIVNLFDYISNLGSIVMIPVMIAIVGLLFRLSILKAIRAGVMVGIGFIGLNLVLNLIWDYIGPVTTILIEKFNLNLSVVDAGWPAAAGLAFATKVGVVIIPFIILVNILMLITKQTKTVNIDIWNYWHFAFTGGVIMTISGSFWYGLLGAAAHAVIALKIADISAKRVQDELGLPGVSIPQGFAITTVPIYMLLDKIYDRLPGFKNRRVDSEAINKKLGIMGEPLMIGLVLGIIIGIAVGYDLKQTAELGIAMAALMLLLPRMVKVIMEGLIPISDGAKSFMQKRFKGSEFYIGLDSAVLLGHSNTITVGILLIPVALILAMVLPFNTTLPFGDLAATAFFIAMATPIHKGDFFRTLISGTIVMGVVLAFASYFAPIITETAMNTGFQFPEGAAKITALSAGNWIAYVILMFAKLKFIGAILIVLLTGGMLYFFRKGKNLEEAQEEAGQ
ncbi:PTS galactitol transporter subunit IIC [Cytobacillus firmus]|uniref:Putative phosphotransferase enzyme IIC component n=1 Tax=Cytobacillus firmus DS1 TaxID=1307436 RepID=W7L322_CYTFI|nr:PTS transporter subunit IIC [Cytobacillus firmus]EWG10011.1 putative phosphotransferase enzyme IIC component [Cytobacillus firmus DS1]